MDGESIFCERRSVRSFLPRRLKDEDLIEILRAGQAAPSAKNRQPWRFVVVEDEAIKNRISSRLNSWCSANKDAASDELSSAVVSAKCIDTAPCVIFVYWRPADNDALTQAANTPDVLSVGAAIENMALAATNLGIGSLWNCDVLYIDEEIGLILEEEGQLLAALILGYKNKKQKSDSFRAHDDSDACRVPLRQLIKRI